MSFTLPKFDSSSLDGITSKLQAKADEFLSSTKSDTDKAIAAAETDDEAAAAGGKLEALRNVAHIVKEQAGKGLGNSKEYLSKVVDQVSTYATEASTTASTQIAGAKDKGLEKFSAVKETATTHFTAAKETATTHVSAAKESASTHLAGIQTNLNKAIAQGQGKATAQGQVQAIAQGQGQSSATDDSTTDREISQDEPLSFPFNFIAWIVSFCGGKGIASTTAPSTSTESTSKEISTESLQNAAATLTETFTQQIHQAQASAGEKIESARSSVTGEVEAVKE